MRLPHPDLFVIFASYFFMGVFIREVTPLVSLVYYLVYLLTLIYIAFRWKTIATVLFRDPFIPSVVILAIFSYFWSVFPDITLKRSLAMAASTAFGIYVGTCYNPLKLTRFLSYAISTISVLSLALAVGASSYAYWLDPNGGGLRLRGALGHPNQLGQLMGLGAALWLLRWSERKGWGHKLLCVGMMSLCIIPILLTKSAGSLVSISTLILTVLVIQFLNLLGRKAVLMMMILFPTLYGVINFILTNSGMVLRALGREENLTGRVPLWTELWGMVLRRPLWGYGFEAFWAGGEDGPAGEIWRAIGWKAPYAHNGFLDVIISLGFVGFILLVLSLLRNLWIVATNFGNAGSGEIIFPAVILIYTITSNLSEGILIGAGFSWILYVFSSTALSVYSVKITRKHKYWGLNSDRNRSPYHTGELHGNPQHLSEENAVFSQKTAP